MSKTQMMVLSGTSHPGLAEEISSALDIKLGKVQINRFPDGEIGVQILENVRGRDLFVVQSIAKDPNLYLIELLILIDALKRASARQITAVIPYFGYARQDRKDKGRVPITAKLVADLLERAGVTRLLTMDLHAEQVQGFFDIPVDHLFARPVLKEAIQKLNLEQPVVVTPDIGSIKLARNMARDLNADFAILDKCRKDATDSEVTAIIGDVQGRDVILVDDMYSTGGTLKKASLACQEAGAGRITAAVTHGLFASDVIKESKIDTLLVTNTIPLPSEIDTTHIQIISIARLFASAIQCIADNQSISSLFSADQ